MIGLDDVKEAKKRIHGYTYETPIVSSNTINEIVGADIYFKCENFQKTGTFKVRGAFNYIMSLSEEERKRGVVCYSSGNHAQAVAYAAALLGIEAWIIMPDYTSPIKIESCNGYGGHILVSGNGQKAYQKAIELKEEKKLFYIDPSNDDLVIAGQGTIGIEILEKIPDVDRIYVPVGGGGLLGGIAVAVKSISPKTKVIGVEPVNMDCMYTALQAGKMNPIKRIPSIADALGGVVPADKGFEIARAYVDELVIVSEAEIAEATKLILQRTKLYIEPSAAVSLAAVMAKKIPTGGKNMCVLSGGNANPVVLADILLGRKSDLR